MPIQNVSMLNLATGDYNSKILDVFRMPLQIQTITTIITRSKMNIYKDLKVRAGIWKHYVVLYHSSVLGIQVDLKARQGTHCLGTQVFYSRVRIGGDHQAWISFMSPCLWLCTLSICLWIVMWILCGCYVYRHLAELAISKLHWSVPREQLNSIRHLKNLCY